jgi:hypothetical protein
MDFTKRTNTAEDVLSILLRDLEEIGQEDRI